MNKAFVFIFVLVANVYASSSSEVTPQTLGATGYYNLPKRYFEPQYPLWTDGAHKRRWFYLPKGSVIDTGNSDGSPGELGGTLDRWAFPVGTKIWKEFSFPDTGTGRYRRIETRFLEKLPDNTWKMESYLWDEKEQKATLANAEGHQNYYPITKDKSINIPSVAQCRFCHQRGGDFVLGIDALQLSPNRDPNALHTQFARGVTLRYFQRKRLLSYFPEEWKHSPPRIPTNSAVGRSAMGYLHGNCGHCHNPSGRANLSGLFLRWDPYAKTQEELQAFTTGLNKATVRFKIPGAEQTYRLHGGDPEISAVHYRMNSEDKAAMPPIGRKTIDEESVELIRKWIEELPTP